MTPSRAYTALLAIPDAEKTERIGLYALADLQKVALSSDPFSELLATRINTALQISRTLQPKRSLTSVRIGGSLVTNPELMTSHLIKHFQSTMVGGTKSASNCKEYITKAYPHLLTPASTQLLLKPLSSDLVLTALERVRKGASPGMMVSPQRYSKDSLTILCH